MFKVVWTWRKYTSFLTAHPNTHAFFFFFLLEITHMSGFLVEKFYVDNNDNQNSHNPPKIDYFL